MPLFHITAVRSPSPVPLLYENSNKVLQISLRDLHNIMRPVSVVYSAACVLCLAIFWFFTSAFNWGLFGAAMASNATAVITMLAMIGTTAWVLRSGSAGTSSSKQSSWNGFSAQATKVRIVSETEGPSNSDVPAPCSVQLATCYAVQCIGLVAAAPNTKAVVLCSLAAALRARLA